MPRSDPPRRCGGCSLFDGAPDGYGHCNDPHCPPGYTLKHAATPAPRCPGFRPAAATPDKETP